MPVHVESFRVRAYECGPDGRLTVPSLCDWLQEVAGNHAEALGVGMARLAENKRGWMLHRLRLALDRMPGWGETVRIETWPHGGDGLRAHRSFVVRDEAGEPVARAATQWLLVDLTRRRPVRLTPEIMALAADEDREPPLPFPDPPTEPDAPTSALPFRVRRSDLDLIGHVNHVCYVAWALEAAPDHRCTGLNVQFLAESRYGEAVTSEAQPLGDDRMRHRIARDGTTLARLETTWEVTICR